jgi:UDP-N-acetylglucosamine--N-acetylmuramyl-(pentapeptide) pyrophosphoryl-undecaprenol N-acetylglucosamine transferase
VMLREDQLDGLAQLIDALRDDAARRDALSRAARTRGEVHRSGALARLIDRVALAS